MAEVAIMDQTGTQRITSHVHSEVWTYDFPDGRQEHYLKICVQCPQCGNKEYLIAMHHLLSFLHLLSDAAEQHPELVTKSTIREVKRQQFECVIPNDPTGN